MGSNRLKRIISAIVIASMLSGCASTRAIRFTSTPSGALVTAGGGTCSTPCTLDVPARTAAASLTLASGEKEEVRIDQLTRPGAEARYELAKAGEATFKALGVPLLVIGGLAALFGYLVESDNIRTEHSSRDGTLLLVTGGTLIAGGLLFSAGYASSRSADEISPEVNVVFIRPASELSKTRIQLFDAQENGRLKLFPDALPSSDGQSLERR